MKRTSKKPAVILTALFLSACASNTPPPSTAPQVSYPDPATVKAEREASSRIFVLCLKQASIRLDDHKSDAATIAQAALSSCSTEFRNNVKVHSRYLEDSDGERVVAARAKEAGLGMAIEFVLTNRKAEQSHR